MSIKPLIIIAAFIGLTACQSSGVNQAQDIELQGSWNIEVINDKPVIDYSPAQLIFDANGKLSGNNSCNNFFGTYSINGDKLELTSAGNTMKACIDALMDQEQRFIAAMPEVAQANMSNGKLILKDTKGNTQFILSKI
ncbi:MAG: heat shock protein HslJ [Shewanella sp.]|jgi:heat shock protein HslJ